MQKGLTALAEEARGGVDGAGGQDWDVHHDDGAPVAPS